MPKFDHILLPSIAKTIPFKGRGIGGNKVQSRNVRHHAQVLKEKFDAAWESSFDINLTLDTTARALGVRSGAYIEFVSSPDHMLALKSLESFRDNIRLLNVRYRSVNEKIREYACVYIPNGKHSKFLKKISDYLETSDQKKTKNSTLLNNVDDIRKALFESMWTDSPSLMPNDNFDWYEIWIRIPFDNPDSDIAKFRNLLVVNGFELKNSVLIFPERAVLLVRANKDKLASLLDKSDLLAEFRCSRKPASFWTELSQIGQEEQISKLLKSLNIKDEKVSICLLDSGINEHPLLNDLIIGKDTLKPNWGLADNVNHGTPMAGIVAFGDLEQILNSSESISINHRICSVKIYEPNEESPKELWGEYTRQAVLRAETINPNRPIFYCMAITADDPNRGRPSSWSASVDSICFGHEKHKTIVVVSAGNIDDISKCCDYPKSNLTNPIQDPAQSWNAISVGAYTCLCNIDDPNYPDAKTVAGPNEISPFSSTSMMWESKWPIKPDILMEGGNLHKTNDPLIPISRHDSLELLTTSARTRTELFTTINATSAASAKASNLIAKMASKYEEFWPETLRGILINSADWPIEIQKQFNFGKSKTELSKLLRICGYGVPNEERALFSLNNALTYVAQSTIQPYKRLGSTAPTFSEMHFYNIPWPKDILLELGDTSVSLKVTLSYFIDPSPGEIGWKDRYRYQSFGLRFDVNNPGETEEQFQRRINVILRNEENGDTVSNDSNRWVIGAKARSFGSVHSDKIVTTAADLASCNMLGVFPVSGWWKTREKLGKYNSVARYSLVVSLDVPLNEVDIYSIVKAQIDTLIKTPVEIKIPHS